MITEDECIPLILKKFPGFKDTWEEHLKWWGDEVDIRGLGNDFFIFARYVIERLKEGNNPDELRQIFLFVEKMMNEGTEDLQEYVATCFLENLINGADCQEDFSASTFVPLLGKESKKHCKIWDEFIGAKTEGLWDPE
jgi:hypothetical protein